MENNFHNHFETFPDWFTNQPAESNFSKFLLHLKGQPNLTFLQLGAYLGHASVWLLKEVLTRASSTLIDVDIWRNSGEIGYETLDFEKIFELYKVNMIQFPNVQFYRTTSLEFLSNDKRFYDFIYIDGAHDSTSVLIDAELSLKRLKSGGIIAFDDYLWDLDPNPNGCPRKGIDMFIDKHSKEIEIIEKNWQLWIRSLN